jgi:hypothetical protein
MLVLFILKRNCLLYFGKKLRDYFFIGKKLWEIMGNFLVFWKEIMGNYGKLFFGMGEIISRDGEGRESLKYGAAKISHNFP